jgi:hypothetical protein
MTVRGPSIAAQIRGEMGFYVRYCRSAIRKFLHGNHYAPLGAREGQS